MINLIVGQKVRNANSNLEMEVIGQMAMGCTATHSKIIKGTSNNMTICSYIKNGKRIQKSFQNSELNPI